MSAFTPNAVMALFKDGSPATEVTDDFGQVYDNASPSVTAADAVGLSAYVAQFNQRTYDPGSQQVTVLTKYKIRVRPNAAFPVLDISAADRLRDERTGRMYQVDDVGDGVGVVQLADLLLVCKRVT